ncbi:SUMF1/EgtB/PvdO family nonheme iron enzyme [bacterium]|nr:SUMF1/EgtB/PvdO family nonheme iron enzyme [bacterium]
MKRLLVFFCFTILSITMFGRTIIAVQDFTVTDVPESAGMVCSEEIRNVLVNNDTLEVLDRGSMTAIMAEQNLQQSGCTDAACAVELGKLLAANMIIFGSVTKLGKTYYLNVKGVNVETARITFSKSSHKKGEIDAVIEMAHNIAVEIDNENFGGEQEKVTAEKEELKAASTGVSPAKDLYPRMMTIPAKKGKKAEKIPSFAIGVYEVSNHQYFEYLKDRSNELAKKAAKTGDKELSKKAKRLQEMMTWKRWKEPEKPAAELRYEEVLDYCEWLSTKMGNTFRLPTVKEWIHAASGENKDFLYPWGDDFDGTRCWYRLNTEDKIQEIGKLPPTGYGLYDIIGNVWEYTSDIKYNQKDIEKKSKYPQHEVYVKGGSYHSYVDEMHLKYEKLLRIRSYYNNVGFRVLMENPKKR